MYRVKWSRSSTAELASLCVDHPDRWSDIDVAEHDISYRLSKDPFRYGVELSEGLRRIISKPLLTYFSVEGNQVEVTSLKWLENPP